MCQPEGTVNSSRAVTRPPGLATRAGGVTMRWSGLAGGAAGPPEAFLPASVNRAARARENKELGSGRGTLLASAVATGEFVELVNNQLVFVTSRRLKLHRAINFRMNLRPSSVNSGWSVSTCICTKPDRCLVSVALTLGAFWPRYLFDPLRTLTISLAQHASPRGCTHCCAWFRWACLTSQVGPLTFLAPACKWLAVFLRGSRRRPPNIRLSRRIWSRSYRRLRKSGRVPIRPPARAAGDHGQY